MATVSRLLEEGRKRLGTAGITTPGLDAEVLLGECVGLPRHMIYIRGEQTVDEEVLARFEDCISRRERGEPVAYITGRKEFWSLDFEVTPDVLIPRPDTECLVEEVLKLVSAGKTRSPAILEIGTGSGAVAIALALEMKNAHIVAGDISSAALSVARRNAKRHGVDSRLSFFCGDLCEPISEKFDIVVSNPPYISKEDYAHLSREVREYEPVKALLAGPKGTEYHEALVTVSYDVLCGGGGLIMEMGAGQKNDIEHIFCNDGRYEILRFRKDYGGNIRVVSVGKRE